MTDFDDLVDGEETFDDFMGNWLAACFLAGTEARIDPKMDEAWFASEMLPEILESIHRQIEKRFEELRLRAEHRAKGASVLGEALAEVTP